MTTTLRSTEPARRKLHKHEKLGITFAQFGALLGVRELVRQGYMHHKKAGDSNDYDKLADQASGAHIINMGVGCRGNDHCGTVGCIGGTVGLIMGMGVTQADHFVGEMNGPLQKLFYPPRPSDYNSITAQQVVQAIDNFIKDGDPRWPKILTLKQWSRTSREAWKRHNA